jgi:deoxyribose-phosphate aldolase
MDLPLRFREIAQRLGSRPPTSQPILLGAEGDQGLLWAHGEASLQPWDASPAWDLAPLLDHTLLKAGATRQEIEGLCEEAKAYGFASVCINPCWVAFAASKLAGSPVRVCTVVGFPLGATSTPAKAFEAQQAAKDGAQEIDMVLDLGATRSGDWAHVEADCRALRAAVPSPVVLKIILETCLLDDAQKAEACRIAERAGLDFVKTSTGFSTAGATEADVALMRRTVGPHVGVKASGGIRTREQALAMIRAGATRLGVSASLAIAGTSSVQSESTY